MLGKSGTGSQAFATLSSSSLSVSESHWWGARHSRVVVLQSMSEKSEVSSAWFIWTTHCLNVVNSCWRKEGRNWNLKWWYKDIAEVFVPVCNRNATGTKDCVPLSCAMLTEALPFTTDSMSCTDDTAWWCLKACFKSAKRQSGIQAMPRLRHLAASPRRSTMSVSLISESLQKRPFIKSSNSYAF